MFLVLELLPHSKVLTVSKIADPERHLDGPSAVPMAKQ